MSDSLRLKVASPCSANWDSMDGDDRCRFCSLCQKNVYNLVDLSASEARQFIEDQEDSVCVRFYQRKDGTVLTSDCPVGRTAGRRRIRKRVTALAFAGLVAAGVWNFARSASASEKAGPKEYVVDQWIDDFRQLIGLPSRNAPEVIMGDVCIAPPPTPPALGTALPSPPSDTPPAVE